MSYLNMARMTESSSLRQRLTACAAEQRKNINSALLEVWIDSRIWSIVASAGWSQAWDSAIAADNQDPGADSAVITDGMILAVIQPMT